MSRIDDPTGPKSTPELTTEPSFHEHKVSLGKSASKLTDLSVKAYLKVFNEQKMQARLAFIKDTGIPTDAKRMILEAHIMQKLNKLESYDEYKSHHKLISLFNEIIAFCSPDIDDRGNTVFLDDQFQSFYKPLIEEFVQKRPLTNEKQTLPMPNFQANKLNPMKEMLGLWFTCTINNHKDFRSFLENPAFIKSILFTYISVHDKINDEDAILLAEALETNNTLTSLDLTNHQFGNDAFWALTHAFKLSSTLTDLNLYNNQIGEGGAVALAEALKENKSIKTLNLKFNNMRAAGATALADALKENSTLTSLDFFGNKIKDEGVRELAEALKENKTLTNLFLGANKITDEGVRELADALKENKTLTDLFLEANRITDEGVRALAEALKENKTLTGLYLWDNQISAEGRILLEEMQALYPSVNIIFN